MIQLFYFIVGIAVWMIIFSIIYLIGYFCAKYNKSFVSTATLIKGETGFSKYFLTILIGLFNLLIILLIVSILIGIYFMFSDFGEWMSKLLFTDNHQVIYLVHYFN